MNIFIIIIVLNSPLDNNYLLHLLIETSNYSCDFQLFLYYNAHECSELFSLKLQAIILKIMPAY